MNKEIKQILVNQVAIMKVLRGDGRYEYTTIPISDTIDLLNPKQRPTIPERTDDAFSESSDVKGKLCPCGHIHEPSSSGNGLRTYCVEGSQCNSDKCKDFLKGGKSE